MGVLVDGAAVEVSRKFLAPIREDDILQRRIFEVVHDPHVYIRGAPKKEGSALGVRRKGETVAVLEERSDGWVQLCPSELDKITRKGVTEAYMLVDGKSVGLGKLMKDTGQLASFPSARFSDGGVCARIAPRVELVEEGKYP